MGAEIRGFRAFCFFVFFNKNVLCQNYIKLSFIFNRLHEKIETIILDITEVLWIEWTYTTQ